jgi:hypothetical protein
MSCTRKRQAKALKLLSLQKNLVEIAQDAKSAHNGGLTPTRLEQINKASAWMMQEMRSAMDTAQDGRELVHGRRELDRQDGHLAWLYHNPEDYVSAVSLMAATGCMSKGEAAARIGNYPNETLPPLPAKPIYPGRIADRAALAAALEVYQAELIDAAPDRVNWSRLQDCVGPSATLVLRDAIAAHLQKMAETKAQTGRLDVYAFSSAVNTLAKTGDDRAAKWAMEWFYNWEDEQPGEAMNALEIVAGENPQAVAVAMVQHWYSSRDRLAGTSETIDAALRNSPGAIAIIEQATQSDVWGVETNAWKTLRRIRYIPSPQDINENNVYHVIGGGKVSILVNNVRGADTSNHLEVHFNCNPSPRVVRVLENVLGSGYVERGAYGTNHWIKFTYNTLVGERKVSNARQALHIGGAANIPATVWANDLSSDEARAACNDLFDAYREVEEI